MATRRKKTTAPEPAVEEIDTDEDAFEELDDELEDEDTAGDADEDEDDDLEEIDEDDEPEPEEKPAKKAKRRNPLMDIEKPAFGSAELAEHITSTTGQSFDARSVRMLLRKLAKNPEGPLKRQVGADRARYSFTGPEDPAVKAIVQMVKSGEAQKIKREGLDAVKEKAAAKKAAKATEATPAKKTKKTAVAAAATPAKATKSTTARRKKASA